MAVMGKQTNRIPFPSSCPLDSICLLYTSNIPDNEIEVIQNHVAEIFIIADMGGLQHFQMWVIFAGAIPVSYTHLDVYKRQRQKWTVNL